MSYIGKRPPAKKALVYIGAVRSTLNMFYCVCFIQKSISIVSVLKGNYFSYIQIHIFSKRGQSNTSK